MALPLLGVAWVLAVLAVSESISILSYLLSAAVFTHAAFALIGYCFLNKRVRRNLYHTLMRCAGHKIPLESSEQTSSQPASSAPASVSSNNLFPQFQYFNLLIKLVCNIVNAMRI